MTTVKRWDIATDPDVEEATRERVLAAQETVHRVTDHVVRDRWTKRAPDHADVSPAEAWEDGEPIHYPPAANGAVARHHAKTDMILLARQGGLVSCHSLSDREQEIRVYVRKQVSDQ